MAGILNKFRDLMLGADEEEVVYEGYEEEYEESPRDSVSDYERVGRDRSKNRDVTDINHARSQRTSTAGANSKIIDFQTSVMLQIVIAKPQDVQDAFNICDCVRDNKACVVNLEGVQRENAQRIADFLGGVSYAFNGEIQRISNEIFMIAPANVHISGELKEEIRSSGLLFPLLSSSFAGK